MKKKSVHVSLRITEEEHIRMKSLMALMGYRNVSMFIRDQILKSRVQRRNLRRTEANISRQLEQLTAEVKRIGVNYNQRVKTLNRLANVKDRRGNAIVNARDIEHDMQEMKRMMDGMVKTFTEIRAAVLDSEEEEEGDEKENDDADGP